MLMHSCPVTTVRVLPVLLTWLALALHGQEALSTAFSYQGQLKLEGAPVNGACDFRFRLWDAETGGLQVGPTQAAPALPVAGGLFALALDFGGVFADPQLWLETSVAYPAGTGTWVTLEPRQALHAAPQALYALGAPWTGLLGRPALLGSLAGVSNDGGDVGLVAGPNVTITPDPVGKRITISATAGSGDISAVVAGAGLAGGASSGEATLALAADYLAGSAFDSRFLNEEQAGAVTAGMLADGAVSAAKLAPGALEWGSLAGIPAGLADGDQDTMYAAGAGLALAGTVFSADFTAVAHAVHAHAAADLSTGILDDARIPDPIARDAEIMPTVLANDGSGSGLDADRLDGLDSTAFAAATHLHDERYYTEAELSTSGGGGQVHWANLVGLPAGFADGIDNDTTYSAGAGLTLTGSVFAADFAAVAHAAHLHDGADLSAGTVAEPRIAAAIARDAEVLGLVLANDGSGSGLDADLVDGQHASAFVTAALLSDGNPATAPMGWTDLQGVPAGVADGIDNDALAGLTAAAGQVPKWNGSAWVAAADNDAGGDITAIIAGDGLTGGGEAGSLTLCVSAGTGIAVDEDAVALAPAYADGSAFDARFVNESQADAVATAMLQDGAVTLAKIAPSLVSSLDGVSNHGGNIDLVAGTGITITADNDANTITIAATAATGSGWSLTGNSGIDPATQFLGTADNQPLELRVNGARVLRIESSEDAVNQMSAPNWIGGSSGNTIDAEVTGAVLAGGGTYGGEAMPNRVNSDFGVVGGGVGNQAGDVARPSARCATVAGGHRNEATGMSAVVSGGSANRAVGSLSTVPGGLSNEATNDYTFAAGRRAKATLQGQFVWADSADADFTPSVANSFNVRATNGMRVEAANTQYAAEFVNAVGGDGVRATTNVSRGNACAAVYAVNNGSSPALYARSTAGNAAYLDGRLEVVGPLSVHHASSTYAAELVNTGTGDGIDVFSRTSLGTNYAAVYAYNDGSSPAISAQSTGGTAAYLSGNVTVTGTLTKGAGSFKIDHPLDPANKTLSHSFVESPDMMNVYNGNAALDAKGEAWVELPAWFETLNRDFRYQLTAMGGPGPSLHIADKVKGNRFRIAGGTPGLEVSWQVTGIRQDPYANAHRIQVEEQKPAGEVGTYLHPKAYGKAVDQGALKK